MSTRDGKPVKYETPKIQRNGLDVPPGMEDQLGDPGVRLWVVEGTKKADCTAAQGLCAVALSGVWNWRHTNHAGGKVALGDWGSIALNGRLLVIAFDSDIRTNRSVRVAAVRLAEFLESRRAHVKYLHLPEADWCC